MGVRRAPLELWNRLQRSKFVRAFGLVSGGTAAGQVVGLMAVPLLSRLYTTVAYGEFGVFVAVSSALSAVACLRLDLAIPRCTDDDDAGVVASAGMLGSVLVGFSLMVLLLAQGGVVPGVSIGQTASYALPISVLLGGTWLVLNQLTIRKGEFRLVAARAFIQPLVMLISQGLWAIFEWPGPGLVLGYVIGQAAASSAYVVKTGRGLSFNLTRCWQAIALHRRYISVMTPQGVLNVFNTQLPLLMISWLYAASTTGQFSMTQRVMGLPVGLVGTAMGQVYISFLTQTASNPERARVLFIRVSKVLALVSGMLVVATILFGPAMFGLVLGDKWTLSGEYARIMVFMYAAQMLAAPLSTTLVVMRQEGRQAAWDVLRLGILVACYVLGRAYSLTPSAFAALLCIGVSGSYLLLWNLSRRSIREQDMRGGL